MRDSSSHAVYPDFRPVVVRGGRHEECFEGVAAREVSKNVKPDYVIIGEASNLNVKIGQRGRGEIVLETFGVPAHSSNPRKGINAVYKMARIIERIRQLEPPKHPVLGEGILELTDIKSSPYPGASVVPDYCRATYDRRLLKGETRESVLEPLQKLLDEMMAEDSELKAKVSFARGEEICYTGEKIGDERFFPGWLYDSDSDFVRIVMEALNAKGFQPEITNYDFCTNGSHYAGEAGIKAFGIGPSRENLAHTVDEYIELDQLTGAAECYYAVMYNRLEDERGTDTMNAFLGELLDQYAFREADTPGVVRLLVKYYGADDPVLKEYIAPEYLSAP